MIKKCGIYRIYCRKNKKYYVGSSTNIVNRWQQHRYGLRIKNHPSPYLQNAWDKYGESAFTFKVLEECDKSILHEREQYWIDKIQPKFNTIKVIYPRKNSPMTGRHHSIESKEKMSAAAKKRLEKAENRTSALEALARGRITRFLYRQYGTCIRGHSLYEYANARGGCRRCKNEKRNAEYVSCRVLKTHCLNGHERTAITVTSSGACRVCMNEKKRLITALNPKPGRQKGYKLTPEHIRHSIEGRKGYRHSEETKQKMSLTAKLANRTILHRDALGRISSV